MPKKTFTIDDLLCLLDEVEPGEGRPGYALLVATFRQGPLAPLYSEIEQKAADAGTNRAKIGWEREAVEAHRTLDHLLTLAPSERNQQLAGGLDLAHADHLALMRICAARRARGEGDVEALTELETVLARLAPEPETVLLRRAQKKLDAVLDALLLAYAAEEDPEGTQRRAAQKLLARAQREVRTLETHLGLLAAG